jgi:signal transduction histidine kinase
MTGSEERPLILVVDDDEVSLMLASASLREIGFDVLEATRGEEAIETAGEHKPDAVLLDVIMPGKDGYDACRELRANQLAGVCVPIIMMTSLDDPESIQRAYDAGATEFTIKPVNWMVEAHRLRFLIQAVRAAEALKQSDEQLRQSQKMDAIGRLAGGVAHDFNNLLTAILSYSDLALDDPSDPDHVADCIREIKEAGNSAAGLTRQLLTFGRKRPVQPEALDVNRTVENMEKMLRRLLSEAIELHVNLRSGIGWVNADPGQVEQVVMNLAVNAGDAMPEGGTMWIQTEERDVQDARGAEGKPIQPGRYVTLSVRDTGIGMDESTRAKVFEPFFTTKAEGKGTGLGLATVFGITKQNGGHIELKSEPGKGTMFTIFLPSVGPVAETKPVEEESKNLLTGAETILVAEDEKTIRECIAKTLKQNGYEVLEAEDGQQALDIANESGEGIHLLLTDVVMPNLGGAELACKLGDSHSHVRQVFMSGYIQSQIAEGILRDSKKFFLQKPFSMNHMLRTIRNALGDAPNGGETILKQSE